MLLPALQLSAWLTDDSYTLLLQSKTYYYPHKTPKSIKKTT